MEVQTKEPESVILDIDKDMDCSGEMQAKLTDSIKETVIQTKSEVLPNIQKVNVVNVVTNLDQTKTENHNTDPNIRELPHPIKKLVSKGSLENVVPGKGHCLIGTTAAHIEGDVVNTVQLSRNLNTHQSRYRGVYLSKI